MSSYHTSELIEKHLSNQLSQPEQLEFDKLMASNVQFASDLEKSRTANQFIHQLGLIETTKKLDLLHKKKTTTKFRQTVLSTALVAIILSTCGAYNLLKTTNAVDKTASKNSSKYKKHQTIIKKIKEPQINLAVKKHNEKSEKTKVSTINTTINGTVKKENTLEIDSTDEKYTMVFSDTIETISPLINLNNTDTIAINVQPSDTIDTCGEISLTDLETEPSCIGGRNGEISFTDKRMIGGTSPYKVFIYNIEDEENYLENKELPAGVYSIKVIDVNGCIDTVSNITIVEKRCVKRIDVSLSPTYSEVWEYPNISGVSEYTVIIKNTNDQIIFEKLISLDEHTEWTGQLEDGSLLKKGVYFVELRSSKETVAAGTITIIK
jgi:hypothetical protein